MTPLSYDPSVVLPNAPTRVTFEAHPDAGSTFVSFGAGRCDSESVTNGVGICNADLAPGSATTRQVDAALQTPQNYEICFSNLGACATK